MSFTKQLLEHGKLLTAAAFPTFVETWNWLVNGFGNLRGDGDLNPDEGFVKVDKTVPDRPVIRLINRNKLGGGGEITVTGTDGISVTGSSLKFASESDSNVTVKATVDESGNINCKIGVYYL